MDCNEDYRQFIAKLAGIKRAWSTETSTSILTASDPFLSSRYGQEIAICLSNLKDSDRHAISAIINGIIQDVILNVAMVLDGTSALDSGEIQILYGGKDFSEISIASSLSDELISSGDFV